MNSHPIRAMIFGILAALFPGSLTAQNIPVLPCCIDFDGTTPGGFSGRNVRELEIRFPGPSDDPADGYLHARDDVGGSRVVLSDPMNGDPNCFGDWRSTLGPGHCLELCWDVNLLTDGDPTRELARKIRVIIRSGSLRAWFLTDTRITEGGGPANGWYSFCAPLAPADGLGNLPSNDHGRWIMKDSNGDPAPPEDWNTLLGNVDRIIFWAEFNPNSQDESWCWDNICLRQAAECPDCMDVFPGTWDCTTGPGGEPIFNYTFDVTNNSPYTATVALIPEPTGFNIDPLVVDFSPALAPGDTGTATLSFDGVEPGSEICFDFVLFNPAVGECCREEICLKVPCVKVSNERITCAPVAGSTDYQFTLTNISGGPAENAYLLSKDPGVTITPALIPLGGLADSSSLPIGPVTITGAAPNEDYCFCIVLLDEEQRQCCIQEVCIAIPDCGQGPIPGPDPNGAQVQPCEPNDGTAVGAVIDFETVPGVGVPTETDPPTIINTQYQSTHGVSFSLNSANPALGPRIAKVGPPRTAFAGPVNNAGDDNVTEEEEDNVGSFFLTDDGVVGPPFVVRVDYAVPTLDASGDLLDLDGDESWDIVALRSDGSPIDTITVTAPASANNPGPGDGTLTNFQFSRPAGDPISALEFRYRFETGVGFALDNFSPRALADCMCICDSGVICDPANPGTYTWTFTVQNKSTAVMDHLLIPDPNISPNFVAFPDPLDPGEAAQVTLTLTNQVAGPIVVPLTLVSTADCECCHLSHFLELPDCDCIQILAENLECDGIDPATGLVCYTYSATFQNLTGEVLDPLFFIPANGNPQGIAFDPENVMLGNLAPLATTTVNTTIKIPAGVNEINFSISVHTTDFVECCAIDRLLHVPDCCDCEETIIFEFGPENPPGPVPAGVELINLEQNPGTGKIGFSPDGKITPFRFVYMAASSRGTVVRIDADTGTILGEYYTSPQTHGSPNPSRTTVDKFGECWVGNRNFRSGQAMGSVVRIGLVTGGTRGDRSGPMGGPYVFTPNSAGEYLQGPFTYVSPSVTDRDGDGLIRTSASLANILDWDPTPTGGNDTGGVTLADDECIVNYVLVPVLQPRALAIDSNNDLWVGEDNTSIYQQVFGTTGTLGITRNLLGGYGALIDGNDVLWSVENGIGVHRLSLATSGGTPGFTGASGVYGIGIDPCDGNIWVSSAVGRPPLLREINGATGLVIGNNPQQGGAQGLCVDQSGTVWVSGGAWAGAGVWQHDSSGVYQNTISAPIVASTGVAVDHNGNIWVSDLDGNAAHRIDPTGVPSVDLTSPMGEGAGPYNYSDMTGFVTLGASGQTGIVVFTHDSLCPGTDWGRVSWLATGLQAGCSLTVEVRASDDPLNYPSTWTSVGDHISFCGSGVTGQYIQARVVMTRPSGCPPACDPELCWLEVECCNAFGVGPGNAPPVVDSSPNLLLMPPGGSGPAPGTVDAWVFDPNGGELEIVWSVDGTTALITSVDGEDIVELNRLFPNGISEVVLTVSDGQNVTTATTMVMVGDHEAPVVNCNQGEFVNGDKRVQAFEAVVPDVMATTVATDNVTPSGSLVLDQSPGPGTLVGQGTHPITVTAQDAAGNVGQCTVYLIVEAAVSITSISNYDDFVVGTAIPVELSYNVDPSEIVQTTITVGGLLQHIENGPLEEPLLIFPAAGDYSINVSITNAGGQVSQSQTLIFTVSANPVPPPSQESPLEVEWESEDHEALMMHFRAPNGRLSCVQMSATLAPGSWENIHDVDGVGQLIEYRYQISQSVEPRLFFRLLYIDE